MRDNMEKYIGHKGVFKEGTEIIAKAYFNKYDTYDCGGKMYEIKTWDGRSFGVTIEGEHNDYGVDKLYWFGPKELMIP